MTSRRDFLKFNAGAAIVLPVAPSLAAAAFPVPPDICITDSAITNATTLTHSFIAPSVEIIKFQHDPGEIWAKHLLPLLQRRHFKIAGVTSGQAAFSLAEMSRDYGAIWEFVRFADGRPADLAAPYSLNQDSALFWTLNTGGVRFR